MTLYRFVQSSNNAKVETLWHEITKGSKSYIVVTIYRHPNCNIKDFTEKLDNTLSLLTENRQIKSCIITGDINIDLMKFDLHETTSDYLNTVLSYFFMPTSILPTRVTEHSATLIDHMFYYTKNFEGNTFAGNLFTDITDNFANFLILGSSRIKNTNCRPMVRIFSDKNKQNFKNKLNQYDLQTKNATDSLATFYQKLAECYNSSFRVIRLSRKRAKDKPWVTTAIKQSITKKHILFKNFMLNRTAEDEATYKQYNNVLRTLIRKAEANYFKPKSSNKQNGIKQMWKHLGYLLCPKRTKRQN